jgi:hypothetical protein
LQEKRGPARWEPAFASGQKAAPARTRGEWKSTINRNTL